MDEDIIAVVRNGLREEVEQCSAMRRIAMRHAANCGTPADRSVYRALWISAALRQSPGRAPYLPAVADELLAERARLEGDVRQGRLRVAVETALASVALDESFAPAAFSPGY